MFDFTFHNPVKIRFGRGKERNIGLYMREFDAKRTLLIYGSDRIKKDGLFDAVVASLKENGIEFIELGGVVSNPVLSKVYEGIELARKFNADSVLSVGGGSCLDSAKAIAAGALYEGDVWDFFTGKDPSRALKIFDVITLAATGSEMNSGAVVTNEATKQKFSIHGDVLYPLVSVVNPQLQKSVSREYLTYSAADVIAHSIEGYFTASVQPSIINLYIEANIKTVMKTTEILLADPDNYDARAEFAWAATMALNGLTYVGTHGYSYPNHMLEHAMSAVVNCAHGAGLAVIMPAWMKWYKSRNLGAFERFSREIFGVNSADEGIAAFKAWLSKIGAPVSLKAVGIEGETLDVVVNLAYDYAANWRKDKLYTKENIKEIFELAK
ncbi:iron-containing alcohol dehydrogenase [Campylobacter sp. Marseille-Q3452]|uniref:Iron-containing alcohol dehydrogenase n=1 Tax=Campylobacter massiliensis TaxID=2762557 RepID=A0A842J9I2_9BACT|nr:iron-containing alcohol dehydrogenase [Campylobacter massiliensis]MBC2882659.1 iron-containing alcohol dehydrogenase [Campylobacter massiliensis]